MESIRAGQVKVPEIYWWKHAQQCQGTYLSLTTLEAVRELQVFDPQHEVRLCGCFSHSFRISLLGNLTMRVLSEMNSCLADETPPPLLSGSL